MHWIKNLFAVIISTSLVLVALELVLSSFPVTDVPRTKPLTKESSPFDVSAESNTKLTFSSGSLFKNPRVRRTNSLGFFSDFDYQFGEQDIVVIGDSFVEGLQVDFGKTFHQLLGNYTGQKVYNFGISGAPLSQYEAYLSEVCQKFPPKKVIIPIIANDFNQSLYKHRKKDGFFHYHDGGILKPSPYALNFVQRTLTGSSLVRYFYFHLGGAPALSSIREAFGANALAERTSPSLYEKATTYFLDNMKNYCITKKNIIFLVDANRSDDGIYGGGKRLEYMTQFIAEAQRLGYTVVDLTAAMKREFERTGTRFEFSYDGHWNAWGHKFVAKQVIELLRKH